MAAPQMELSVDLELFKTFFEESSDGLYVLDPGTRHFLLVNEAFEKMFGYTVAEMDAQGLSSTDLLLDEDKRRVEKRATRRIRTKSSRYSVKVRARTGDIREVELSVRSITWHGRELHLGSVRDMTRQLRQSAELERSLTEAALANGALLSLAEKLGTVPAMTRDILDAGPATEILDVVRRHLSNPRGFGFQKVTIYFVEQGSLVPTKTNLGRSASRYRLDGNSDLAKVAGGTLKQVWRDCQMIYPITNRGAISGVLCATLSEEENRRIQAHALSRNAIDAALQNVCQVIGLAISNRRLFEEVREQSIVDPLTGVYNRRYLDRVLTEEFSRAKRYSRNLSLIIIDLDHFKIINDTCGHAQGDAVLRRVAEILRARFRVQDTLCRYGGDEFVFVSPETSAEDAHKKMEQVCRLIRGTPFENHTDPENPLRLTLSVGIADMSSNPAGPEQLWDTADRSVFVSKRRGRDRITVYKQRRR